VGVRDVAPGHHQIADVGAVEGFEGDVVGLGHRLAVVGRLVPGVEAAGRVLVEAPAANAHAVVPPLPAALEVRLGLDVRAGQAAALALTGDHAHGLERPVLAVRALAGVLDPVPNAHHDPQQLEAQLLVLADHVEGAAQLDPPVAVLVGAAADAPEQQVVLGDLAGPGRSHEGHRAIVLARSEQDRAALGLVVTFLQSQGLAVGRPRLAPFAERGAGFQGQATVAGGVHVAVGRDRVERLGLVAAHPGRGQSPALGLGAEDAGVQQQLQVRLALAQVVERQVEQLPGPVRVAHGVLQADLLDQAAFAPAGARAVHVGSHDVHADLAGGVAAQARAVLHQQHPSAVARCGQGGANPRHAPAGHQQIDLAGLPVHVRLVRVLLGAAVRSTVDRRPGVPRRTLLRGALHVGSERSPVDGQGKTEPGGSVEERTTIHAAGGKGPAEEPSGSTRVTPQRAPLPPQTRPEQVRIRVVRNPPNPMEPENPVVVSRGNLQRLEEVKRVLKRAHIDAWITRPHGGKVNS
jgi:hypothetical protein